MSGGHETVSGRKPWVGGNRTFEQLQGLADGTLGPFADCRQCPQIAIIAIQVIGRFGLCARDLGAQHPGGTAASWRRTKKVPTGG